MVMRDKERKTLRMEVGALPDDDNVAALTDDAPAQATSSNRLGVTVVELTDEQKKNLDIHSGVVVREVMRGPGAMVGLRPGDIITNLDNQSVDSVETFTEIAGELPDNRSISMRVIRQGRASYITFRLAE